MNKVRMMLLLCSMVAASNSSVFAMKRVESGDGAGQAVKDGSFTVEQLRQLTGVIAGVLDAQVQLESSRATRKQEEEKKKADVKKQKEEKDWQDKPKYLKAAVYGKACAIFLWQLPDKAWKNKVTVLKVLIIIGFLKSILPACIIDGLLAIVMKLGGKTITALFGLGIDGIKALVAPVVSEMTVTMGGMFGSLSSLFATLSRVFQALTPVVVAVAPAPAG